MVQWICWVFFLSFTSQSTIFQLCQDKSFWVEPGLNRGKVSYSKTQCSASVETLAHIPLISSQALYYGATPGFAASDSNTEALTDALYAKQEIQEMTAAQHKDSEMV